MWRKYIERLIMIKGRDSLAGFTFTNSKPYLVAVCPVLKSDFTGPVAGYLIVSRIITEEKQNVIKNLFGLADFKIEKLKDTEKETNTTHVIMEDSEKYRILYKKADFFGNYSVGVNVEKEKKLWNIVKGSNLKLIIFYIFSFLIFCFVFYAWFKSRITNKIITLVTGIQEVKEGKAEEVKINGNDEIGYLAQEINRYINTEKEYRKIYETIAEKSEAIIFLFNSKGEIIFANSKAKDIVNGENNKTFSEKLFHLLSEILQINQGERIFLSEFKLTDKILVSGWIIPVGDRRESLLFIAHDITYLKKEKEKLLDKAYKDILTSLYNRAFFEIYFRKIINNVKLGEAYSLIFIDLDNLKTINDKFGHVAGDEVIKETANAIRKSIRDSDLAVRWGGDEFVVIIKGSIEQAKIVAGRIQTNLKKVTLKDEAIVPSVSIGITTIDPYKDKEDIIRKADKAAYDAKREGKNKIKIFDPSE